LPQHQGTRLVKGTSSNDDLGQGVLVALGRNDSYIAGGQHVSAVEDYARLGPGFGHQHHRINAI
jgi:hypothetical protein